jgi:hypothetical protein
MGGLPPVALTGWMFAAWVDSCRPAPARCAASSAMVNRLAAGQPDAANGVSTAVDLGRSGNQAGPSPEWR